MSSKPNSKVTILSKTKKRVTNIIQPLLQKSTVHCSLLKSSQRKFSCGTQASNLNNSNLVLTSISYDFDSPIFRKLISLLNEGVNKKTQLQIEQLLQNQALEIAKNKLKSHGESFRQNSNHSLLILKLKEISPRLDKIINNYKTKLKLMDSKLSSLS